MFIKDFLEIGFQGKDVITIFLSGAAFTISFFNYRRDNGQLLLSVNIGKIVSVSAIENGEDALYISVTNTGRRNVFVKSIIFNQSGILIRFLQKMFPNKVKSSYSMWMPGRQIPSSLTSILFDNDFRPQKYVEGESKNATIPLNTSQSKQSMMELFAKSKSMFIEDTTGKKHYLSCREYRAVISSLKKMV